MAKDFIYNSAVTLTLDLKAWFMGTAHPFPKGILLVKYQPDQAKGREYLLWTAISNGQTDGKIDRQTDGQTYHYRVGPNYINTSFVPFHHKERCRDFSGGVDHSCPIPGPD